MSQSRKIGLAPGTLVHVGDQKMTDSHIRIIEYTADEVFDHASATLEDTFRALDRADTVTWVRISGLHDLALISTLGERIDVHPLVLEDIVNTGQRTKAETYDDVVFIVFRHYHDSGGGKGVAGEQVSLILSRNCVISFHESHHTAFDVLTDRIRDPRGRFRRSGADYLAYAMLDLAVDQAMLVYEELFGELETIENRLFLRPDSSDYRRIHRVRRNLVALKKSIGPMKDVLNLLRRSDNAIVGEGVRLYLRDVYDHVSRLMENTEDALEISFSLMDTYMAQTSLRMNEIIKVLTIISTIFIPLTFIVGIYGMNFDHMPELAWKWGYAGVWVLMTAIAGGMLVYFRRMKWF